MTSRVAIHVIDDDHKRRAQIARFAYALGHHAEVYSSSAELAAHAPHEGVVVALEDAVHGGFSQLVGLLNRDGRWLAVIATSADPSIDKAVRAITASQRPSRLSSPTSCEKPPWTASSSATTTPSWGACAASSAELE